MKKQENNKDQKKMKEFISNAVFAATSAIMAAFIIVSLTIAVSSHV